LKIPKKEGTLNTKKISVRIAEKILNKKNYEFMFSFLCVMILSLNKIKEKT